MIAMLARSYKDYTKNVDMRWNLIEKIEIGKDMHKIRVSYINTTPWANDFYEQSTIQSEFDIKNCIYFKSSEAFKK